MQQKKNSPHKLHTYYFERELFAIILPIFMIETQLRVLLKLISSKHDPFISAFGFCLTFSATSTITIVRYNDPVSDNQQQPSRHPSQFLNAILREIKATP